MDLYGRIPDGVRDPETGLGDAAGSNANGRVTTEFEAR
jgi:hypothetical protein